MTRPISALFSAAHISKLKNHGWRGGFRTTHAPPPPLLLLLRPGPAIATLALATRLRLVARCSRPDRSHVALPLPFPDPAGHCHLSLPLANKMRSLLATRLRLVARRSPVLGTVAPLPPTPLPHP